MIVINKKRLILIVSAVIISVGVCFSSNTYKGETVQTVGLPVSNKVIVLDARSWKTR